MTAHRAAILLAAAALLAPLAPASAQVPDEVVVSILRECAKIGDPSARLACYDNNVRAGQPGGGTSEFGQRQSQRSPAPASPAPPARPAAEGFGADSIRGPERFADSGQRELTARVKAAEMRQPGVYLLTLEDGAQWLFNESTPNFYRAPRPGETVEIQRGALGGYLLVSRGQQAVRIQRVR